MTVHGFLLVGGEKMSKTSLNQIAPADLVDEFGVDGFRYHFLRDTPVGPDGDFSYERMVDRYNSDLANNFGNLLSRVATVVGQEVRRRRARAPGRQPARARGRRRLRGRRPAAWGESPPSVALEATWRLIRETNAFLEDNEPWKLDPGPEVEAVLGDALEALRIVSVLASPALPTTCAEAWQPHRPRRLAARPAAARGGAAGAATRAG